VRVAVGALATAGGSRDAASDQPRALDLAIAAFAITALATTAAAFGQPALAPVAALPILVALGGFCLAALTRRSAPSVAWVATILGSYAAATIPIAQARAADPGTIGVGAWLGFAIPASVGAIVTLAIAARYASRPGRRLDPVAVPLSLGLLVWLVIACGTTVGLIVAGEARADPAFTWVDVATAPIATFAPFVVLVTALGVAADLRSGAERAVGRLGPATASRRSERAWSVGIATVRELLPGQSAADEASLAAERTRLAGDLHAVVLPTLRRAIAEAEAGGDPDVLARQLRAVDLELERVMADRWPVVLEAFGLVAALEDLAEQVEAGGGPAVELDVGRVGERPEPQIERAAWRIAQVTIDNAVRHAGATTITVAISVDASGVALSVADDGRGFDRASLGAVRPAARGLADAQRRAAAIGGSLDVGPRPDGGTVVRFAWTRSSR
jgi:signal transduction histidine kinase